MVKETSKDKYWYGVGRRKTAVATVRLYEGKDTVLINDNKSNLDSDLAKVFELIGKKDSFGLTAKVSGGGKEGQIGAMKLAIARALEKYDPEFRSTLKKAGYLSRDPREKERKKPGLKGARRAPQFSKR